MSVTSVEITDVYLPKNLLLSSTLHKEHYVVNQCYLISVTLTIALRWGMSVIRGRTRMILLYEINAEMLTLRSELKTAISNLTKEGFFGNTAKDVYQELFAR